MIIMSSIQSEPQGLDSFSEGLASFQQQEIQQATEPTAAVESASLNIKPKKHVTIVEPSIKPKQMQTPDTIGQLKDFYNENQMLVMGVVAVGIAYYYYKKDK